MVVITISTTPSMYVLGNGLEQKNNFNLGLGIYLKVWFGEFLSFATWGYKPFFKLKKCYKAFFHSLIPLWIFRNLLSLQRKAKKMKVAQESQKEVLQKHLCSGGSTRNTNQDPALFMGMAPLAEHQHQVHLSHLEVMHFMFEVTLWWFPRWHDLVNTKGCFSQHMKCLFFIHTWCTPLEMLLTPSTPWMGGMLNLSENGKGR